MSDKSLDRAEVLALMSVLEVQQAAILAECEAIHGTLKYMHAMGMEARKTHRHRVTESGRVGHRDEDRVREVDTRQLEINEAVAKAEAKAKLSPQEQKAKRAARRPVRRKRRG